MRNARWILPAMLLLATPIDLHAQTADAELRSALERLRE
jgi:hypothetical protein